MTSSESLSLREVQRPGTGAIQQEPIGNEDEAVVAEAASRAAESSMRRASVLAGQALLQLPIWGFALSFGVFQEYFSAGHWTLAGSQSITGVIGTTSNGVMYLAMPFLFAAFSRRWAHRRRTAALTGTIVASGSFLLAPFSSAVWHLVAALGVAAALGCSLMYSPTTLSLGEWFSTRRRSLAYGVVFSCKNIVGSTCPFLFRLLLDRFGFGATMRIWAAVTAASGAAAVLLIPTPPSSSTWSSSRSMSRDEDEDGTRPSSASPADGHRRGRAIPWDFLGHGTFYVYAVATALQSSGYGIPQTYLNTYAKDVVRLSDASATLLLTLFNIPGIASSAFFGYLSEDNHGHGHGRSSNNRPRFRLHLSTSSVTALSAVTSALATWLLWGLATHGDMAILVLFSLIFGFFAGGYSASWAGVVTDMEREAAQHNEPIDSGIVYGLLNGARGIGYVGGGLVGVSLLKVGTATAAAADAAGTVVGKAGYGSSYGPLIIFTGLSTVLGGWGLLWKAGRALRLLL